MGQQQLLLLILGILVVGIAVAAGITLFTDNAVSANREAVANDLANLAVRAQQFFRRPATLDGGGYSFVGLTADAEGMQKLTEHSTNANGEYAILSAGTTTGLVIRGVGTERADGSHLVTMDVFVFRDKPDSLVAVY